MHKIIDNLPLTVDGINIEQCNSAKFPGMTFDSLLNCQEHRKIVTNKVRSSLYAIDTVKKLLPVKHLETLYCTVIHTYINLWSGHLGKIIIKFLVSNKILQKKSLCTVL